MKKIFGIAVMMLGFAVASNAQQAPAPAQQPQLESRKQEMKDLNITTAQKKDLKAANMEFKNKMQTVKNDASLSKQEKKIQLQSIKKEKMDKMSTILTPDQQQKMNDMKKMHTRRDRANAGGVK